MEVKSRFQKSQILFLFILFMGMIGLGVYLLAFPENMISEGKDIASVRTGGLILVIPCLLLLFFWLRSLKLILINDASVTIKGLFSKTIILKSDIKQIELRARKNLGFISSGGNVDGSLIHTLYGKSIFIADAYYGNVPEMKVALQHNFQTAGLPAFALTGERRKTRISTSDYSTEKYSGVFLLSLNGILFSGIVTSMLYTWLIYLDKNPLVVFVFAPFILMFYFVYGSQANYFLVSPNELIVKNQLWWWREIKYNMDDIHDVVLERWPKQSISLKVNTKHYKSGQFPAGSLSYTTWGTLLDKLRLLQVTVIEDVYLGSKH
jgi:hypothetical protein